MAASLFFWPHKAELVSLLDTGSTADAEAGQMFGRTQVDSSRSTKAEERCTWADDGTVRLSFASLREEIEMTWAFFLPPTSSIRIHPLAEVIPIYHDDTGSGVSNW